MYKMSLVKEGNVYKVVLMPDSRGIRKPSERPKPQRKKPEKTTVTKKVVVEKPLVAKPQIPDRDYGKIVVYTCVTGGYDNLIQPTKTEGVDYICFTDNLDIPSCGWTLKPIPKGLESLSKVKQQRMVKALPHKYLSEYDISIWVDGSVEVKGNVKDFISPFIYNGHSVFVPKHPNRVCIYKECTAVKAIRKDTTDLPDKQMKKYKEEGFPENYGLVQSNIMVRWHNNEDCKTVMEVWADEIRNFSHRDQLSFNYALWKTKTECFEYLDKKTCNSKYFHWNTRHGTHETKSSNKKKTK